MKTWTLSRKIERSFSNDEFVECDDPSWANHDCELQEISRTRLFERLSAKTESELAFCEEDSEMEVKAIEMCLVEAPMSCMENKKGLIDKKWKEMKTKRLKM